MNDCQRRQIETMRKQGMGYKAIARETKLSRDSVRNYCRWHHLNGYGVSAKSPGVSIDCFDNSPFYRR